MIATAIAWLVGRGIASKLAPWILGAAAFLLAIGAFAGAKALCDRSIIDRHDTKQELKQVTRDRAADSNLQVQKGRDVAAAQQRQQEVDNATRNIPDQKPSPRQYARACLELRREAANRQQPAPAC